MYMYIWNRIVRAETFYLLTHWELTRSSWSYLLPHEATRWFRETQKKSSSWNNDFWIWGGDGFEHGWPRRPQPTWYCKVQIELAQTRRHPVDPPNILWIHLTSRGSTWHPVDPPTSSGWIFDFETTLFNLYSLILPQFLQLTTFSLLYCHYPYVAYRNGVFCVTSIVGLPFFSNKGLGEGTRSTCRSGETSSGSGQSSRQKFLGVHSVRECRFVLCIHLDTPRTFKSGCQMGPKGSQFSIP